MQISVEQLRLLIKFLNVLKFLTYMLNWRFFLKFQKNQRIVEKVSILTSLSKEFDISCAGELKFSLLLLMSIIDVFDHIISLMKFKS